MLLNKFEYMGTAFIVQSYLKNDFANVCEVNGDLFCVDFINQSITTTSKENNKWKQKANKINIKEIETIIDNIWN